MVFTVAATMAFFTSADQMGLTAKFWNALQGEGLVTVEDLEEFEDSNLTQISVNLRNPASILDPAHVGPTNTALQIRPQNFTLGAKSLNPLKVSAALVRYYAAIDRPLTAANMHYTVGKFFILQWNAIKDTKKESDDVGCPEANAQHDVYQVGSYFVRIL